MTMKFRARTNDKRQLDIRWDLINAYLAKWKPGTVLNVEITRRAAKKSNPLRHYYWAVVVRTYADHLGYDADEIELLHRQLKIVYFRVKPDKKGIYRNVPSVFSNESEIDVPAKKKFVDWVIRCAAKDGCYIPDPGE